MEPSLYGAKLKINRADKHIRDIESRILALHETEVSRVDIHPQFGTERLVHEFTDPTAFDDLAILLGDALHNLKSALDYAWWHAARQLVPSIVDGRTKLPVRETKNQLESWLTKRSKGAGKDTPAVHEVCSRLSDFLLHEVRPYNGGNSAVWPIHVLNNVDKHRLLIPVMSSIYIKGIEVVDEHGESWCGLTIPNFQRPPFVVDYAAGLHVKEKGHLSVEILVKDSKLHHSLRLPFTLFNYSDYVMRIVESFEAFLEGNP